MEFNEVNTTVQVKFRKETAYGDYQDALYFSQAEYDALTPEQIEVMKQARVDAWIYAIQNPPTPPEPVEPEPVVEEPIVFMEP